MQHLIDSVLHLVLLQGACVGAVFLTPLQLWVGIVHYGASRGQRGLNLMGPQLAVQLNMSSL